jgi:haloacetate dehalogenase
MFDEFERTDMQTECATIAFVHRREWSSAAASPRLPVAHSLASHRTCLARDYTVIATDLRGYGDSRGPQQADASAYSKRTMARDQFVVMKHFGFDRFAVIGHDRGARVGYRLGLDHPGTVLALCA